MDAPPPAPAQYEPSLPPARRPARRRRLLVALLAAAGAVTAAAWWLVTPDAFGPPSSRLGLDVELGQPAVVGTALFPSRDIVIVGIEPATPPPHGMTVTFHGCSTLSMGAARGDLATVCGEVRDVKGLVLQADNSSPWHVVARMEFSQPGSYETKGFVVSYRDGLRRGRQTSGMGVKLAAPRS